MRPGEEKFVRKVRKHAPELLRLSPLLISAMLEGVDVGLNNSWTELYSVPNKKTRLNLNFIEETEKRSFIRNVSNGNDRVVESYYQLALQKRGFHHSDDWGGWYNWRTLATVNFKTLQEAYDILWGMAHGSTH